MQVGWLICKQLSTLRDYVKANVSNWQSRQQLRWPCTVPAYETNKFVALNVNNIINNNIMNRGVVSRMYKK